MKLNKLHHVAVVCSDYGQSKSFYTNILGFGIENESYNEEHKFYKLDLSLNGTYCIELFHFPDSPEKSAKTDTLGLWHIAFEADNVEECVQQLKNKGITNIEPIRTDNLTQKKYTFFSGPDGLSIEIYEANG